jgi:hypothetical protein
MKQYGLLLVAFLVSLGMKAQDAKTISLNLYGGYTFSDKVSYDSYYGYVKESFEYGVGLEYFPQKDNSIELKYLRMDTKMPFYGPFGTQLNNGDDKGAINYVLLGGTHYFETGSTTVLPYLGGGLGVGILKTPQSGNDTNFAWEIRGGVKIKTPSIVSVNFNAYLQSMTSAAGYSYYWSYYGPIAVNDYVSTYQFGLGAEIGFNFK